MAAQGGGEEEELDYDEAELDEVDASGAAAAIAPASAEDLALLYDEFEGDEPITQAEEAYERLQHEATKLREDSDSLRRELAALREEHERVMKQNVALKRNISCLFKTARREIERKDAQLASRASQAPSRRPSTGSAGAPPDKRAKGPSPQPHKHVQASSLPYGPPRRGPGGPPRPPGPPPPPGAWRG